MIKDIVDAAIKLEFLCEKLGYNIFDKAQTNVFFDKMKFHKFFNDSRKVFNELDERGKYDFICAVDSLAYYTNEYIDDRTDFVDRVSNLSEYLFRVLLHHKDIDRSEPKFQKEVIENFNSIFPDYIFVAKEVTVELGRIDILAKDINGGRDVIIELKIKDGNGKGQLLRYAKSYKNPILINLSEKEVAENRRNKKVIYKTYSYRN